MNDECGDVGDDEDGDGRLVWERILGSIRTDQSSETYPHWILPSFRHHHTTPLPMSSRTAPLSTHVVYECSALDRVGITRWDGDLLPILGEWELNRER